MRSRRLSWGLVSVALAIVGGVVSVSPVAASVPSEPPSSPDPSVPSESSVVESSAVPDVAGAVAHAAVQAWAAREAALIGVDDEAAVAALEDYFATGTPARFEVDGWINALRDSGQRVRASDVTPASVTVEQVVPMAAPLDDRATAVVCVVDSLVTFVPATSGAGDQVVDDTPDAHRAVWEFVNQDGRWKLFASSIVQPFPGATTCPPADAESTTLTDIARRVHEINAASWYATVNLDAPGNEALIGASYVAGGQTEAGFTGFLNELQTTGNRVLVNSDLPPSATVEQITAIDGPPPTRAEVIVCDVDTGVLYQPDGAPDGQDVVINNDIAAIRASWQLALEDGTWQLESSQLLDDWGDVVQCPEQ